jgi:hypothetical protein
MFAIAKRVYTAGNTQKLLGFTDDFEHHEQTPLILKNGDDGAVPTDDLSLSKGIWE